VTTPKDTTPPPVELGDAGRKLWADVLATYALEAHERVILREACEVTDLLSILNAQVRREGPTVPTPGGGIKSHPAEVAARANRIVLGRLLAHPRFPADDDAAGAPRGPRGFYGKGAA